MKITCFVNFVRVLLMHVYMACFAVAITNSTSDQTALLALKSHITDDPHNILANNWSTTAFVCSWVGVTCGASHQRVTKLDLSDMGLNGTIPSQLGNLSFLAFLSFRNNSFYGSLPEELIHLRRLKFLDFGFNYFSGAIPPFLGSLHKLEILLLEANNFIGNFNLESSFFNTTSLKSVNISHNQLEGFIPSKFFNLSSLQIIDLSFNSLYGELLVDIFDDLPKLQGLYLSQNRISGAIPSSLFECQQLQILSLSYNYFSGSIPAEIGNLTMLKKLYLDHNNFNGEIPEKIGSLTKLENLSMSTNNLTGSIPSSLGNCSLLQEINFSENKLTGAIPLVIGDLGSLRILRMHDNFLSGKIPSTLFNISTMKAITMFVNHLSGTLPSTMRLFLPNLMELRLGENELDGIIPSSISNASKLAFLDLSDNSFTGFIPSTLGNLRRLQGLNLANNHLTSESSTSESSFLTTLANCKELRKVVLSGNPLNITLPTSIGNLSTSLEQFLANNCNSKGIIPREISNLTSLIALNLANNQFSGNIPTTIGKLEKLQVLYLQGNKLQGTIMYDLCRLRSLAYLSFGGNKLVGSIPECLGNITSLRSLNLSSNNLNFTIPSTFWNLKYILTISMSSNFLSGFIPSDIGNLMVVENFDLSSNKLSGEIPSSIGNLLSLTHLSLAKNGLHGPIPEFISFLKGLEFLDLSYNNLSGVIPKSLGKLLYLQHFNVSFNGLEGEIPNEGPFSYFSVESYMMNYALCGAPRLLVPPCKSGAGAQPRFVFLLKLIIPLIVSILLAYYILLWSKFRKRNMPSIAPTLRLETSFPCTEQNRRRYTYLELQQATDWFSEDNLIGTGHFSSVYKGKLKDGKAVAIKVFNVEEETSLRSFDVECEVLSGVSHPNLVRTVCISNSINFKALVMEYMANGSLEKWLHTHNYDLDILQRFDIMIETAKAVRYLHQRCIIHCDIKPSNILLDEDMVAHVSDFSIAKIQDPVSETPTRESKLMCTIGYVAPEYGLYGTVSTSMDVYSFGILLMETFTGKKPTHEMFTGEMSLRRWVMESLPCEVERVIDPSLLQTEIENIDVYMKCISRVMSLALICSAVSPSERLNMKDVEEKLWTCLHLLNRLRE